MPGLLLRILTLLRDKGPLAPGDAVTSLGEPRYRVLAAFHCLEELGLAAKIYERGTYKIYRITLAGETLLDKALEAGEAHRVLEEALLSLRAHHAPAGQAEASQATP